jgi:putative intracellular protease/amidase
MQIAIALYPGYTALDLMGPYQVFAETPGTEVVFCAERTGRLYDDRKMFHLDIERTFADVPRPDVLVVPGGFIDPRTGPCKVAAEGGPIIDWIRAVHEHTTFTTSVCTGALLLGKAGLLDGLRATTHWAAYDDLRGFGAEPTEQRVVFQGKIVTGAGVSAGIDLALAVLAELHGPRWPRPSSWPSSTTRTRRSTAAPRPRRRRRSVTSSWRASRPASRSPSDRHERER